MLSNISEKNCFKFDLAGTHWNSTEYLPIDKTIIYGTQDEYVQDFREEFFYVNALG